jgi:hypothetical protein
LYIVEFQKTKTSQHSAKEQKSKRAICFEQIDLGGSTRGIPTFSDMINRSPKVLLQDVLQSVCAKNIKKTYVGRPSAEAPTVRHISRVQKVLRPTIASLPTIAHTSPQAFEKHSRAGGCILH